MEATVNKIQVNVMTVANAVVVKETTYQKLKRLSKKYNLQTNDPKFARVWTYLTQWLIKCRWLVVIANSISTRLRGWILSIMVIKCIGSDLRIRMGAHGA